MSTTTNTGLNTAEGSRRLTSETRRLGMTTELIAYIAAVLAVAITALVVSDNGHGGPDPFSAEQALRYITFLAIMPGGPSPHLHPSLKGHSDVSFPTGQVPPRSDPELFRHDLQRHTGFMWGLLPAHTAGVPHHSRRGGRLRDGGRAPSQPRAFAKKPRIANA